MYAVDGVGFVVCTLAMRGLGPPPAYPPGNTTLWSALLRGASTLGLSVLLTPANRVRLASAANSAGWNHVCMELRDLVVRPDGAAAQNGAPPAPVDYESMSSHSEVTRLS